MTARRVAQSAIAARLCGWKNISIKLRDILLVVVRWLCDSRRSYDGKCTYMKWNSLLYYQSIRNMAITRGSESMGIGFAPTVHHIDRSHAGIWRFPMLDRGYQGEAKLRFVCGLPLHQVILGAIV